MHLKHFGDPYDLAKRFLMECLAPGEPWGIVPMFTDAWRDDQIAAYERLLNGRGLSPSVIEPDTDRTVYFRDIAWAGHSFGDPDTGISIEPRRPDEWPKFISIPELSDLVFRNPRHLTLVYDQSYSRQSHRIRPRMLRKLAILSERGIIGFGYLGQASFLILSQDQNAIAKARQNLLDAGVPSSRLIN